MKKLKFSLVFGILLIVFGITNVDALTITEDKTLTEDINEQVVIDGKKVTIDLNGHKISPGNLNIDGMIVTGGADVTIKGAGSVEAKHNGISVHANSKLTLESGNIISNEFGVYTEGTATFIMNGGTITANDNCGLGGNGSSGKGGYTININGGTITSNIKTSGYVSCGVYHPNEGTININGGTITSTNGPGIVQRAGVLNIKGGTIIAQEKTAGITGKACDGKTLVSAYALVIDKAINYPGVTSLETQVTGTPVFSGAKGTVQLFPTDYDFKVDGGVFNEEPTAEQIDEGYVAKKVLEGNNKDKYVVVKESELKYEVISGMISKDDVTEADQKLIEQAIKNKYTLISYYDVLLVQTTKDGDIVGYVSEPTKAVKVTLGLPNGIPEVKEGYERTFVFVRVHNGKVEIIDKIKENDDKTLEGESDKFSTYAVAYNDNKIEDNTTNEVKENNTTTETIKEKTNPKTGDNIVLYITILTLSVIGFATVLIYKKKKQYN